jgi:hypothetical protein
VQLLRGARDIFHFSHGDKVTEMAEFHIVKKSINLNRP